MFPITITFTVNNEAELAKLSLLTTSTASANLKETTPAKKPTTSAATQDSAANTQRTAAADGETAAPAKTAVESSPTAAPVEAAQPASTAATDKVDYPTLQKAVFTLAGKSRDAATALAASFGVKTFKELPESKWAEALAAVQSKLAELGA